jgi:uncharacterized membrane protein YeaQ/YmgE (transglycosylase-associated protein family)
MFFWFSIYKQIKGFLSRNMSFEACLILGVLGAMVGTMINMQTDIYTLGGAPELSLFIVGAIGAAVSKESYCV